MNEHVSRLTVLGFSKEMADQFQTIWRSLESEGYDLYAIYTGAKGSPLEDKASCIICSKSAGGLEWRKVVTPSMDSAAIYCSCEDCGMQYVETALRQKALGRLLKERNTRPS